MSKGVYALVITERRVHTLFIRVRCVNTLFHFCSVYVSNLDTVEWGKIHNVNFGLTTLINQYNN